MSHEIEAAAGGAFLGLFRARRRNSHAGLAGAPCANCATPLQGSWCHQCGQLGEDFHRSIWKLTGEAVEGVLHLDGRLWRTLPGLLFRPARLTHAYLKGHRAPQVPPFRLFLVVLVLVFFAGALGQGSSAPTSPAAFAAHPGKTYVVRVRTLSDLSPDQRAKVAASINRLHIDIGGADIQTGWLKSRMIRVLDDPKMFYLVVESWGERFAFLTLPMAVLLISLAFAFQRRFFIFDHAIFSLHSLSAVGLMVAASEALSPLLGGAGGLILWAAPVHLFVHLRGVYGTSVIGTLARMSFIAMGSLIIGLCIYLGLLLVSLTGMG